MKMSSAELSYASNQEVVAALLRAERGRTVANPRFSDLVKLAAILVIGVGVVLNGIAALVSLSVLGAITLWLSFHHDDVVVERELDDLFDPRTGLPLLPGLETVLRDEHVAASLSGRIAVVAIEVREIAAREVAEDLDAAEALMVSVTHRLQSHGWIGGNSGPFGPLVFLSRPGGFAVVMRDVIDDRTTRWVAGRMLDVLNRPVRCRDAVLDPRAVVGLAVGSSADRAGLVGLANDALRRARREGGGTVVSSADTVNPSATEAWLVSVADDSAVGRLIDPEPGGGEMFAESASFLRALDRALDFAATSGERCFVKARGVALSHWDTPARIAARVNAAGLHGRVGIVVPSDLVDRATRRAWENLEKIRRCGLDLYVDRSGTATPPATLDPRFDGVITVSGDPDTPDNAHDSALGPVVVSVVDRRFVHPTPVPVLGDIEMVLDGITDLGFPTRSNDEGTDRTVVGGRPAHVAQGLGIAAR
jgi:hypothetical protein